MNNGRMWLVVNPTVGIPVFLGAVALTSLTVHHALLNNTTWFRDFFQGSAKKVAMATTAPVELSSIDQSKFAINVTPVAAKDGTGTTSFVVTVTPKADAAPATVAYSALPTK
jgi:light-harvesting protein B-800-850 alpha chain